MNFKTAKGNNTHLGISWRTYFADSDANQFEAMISRRFHDDSLWLTLFRNYQFCFVPCKQNSNEWKYFCDLLCRVFLSRWAVILLHSHHSRIELERQQSGFSGIFENEPLATRKMLSLHFIMSAFQFDKVFRMQFHAQSQNKSTISNLTIQQKKTFFPFGHKKKSI